MDEQEMNAVQEQEFTLEDIMKEFGSAPTEPEQTDKEEVSEEPQEELPEEQQEELPEEESVDNPEEEPAVDGQTRVLPDLSQVVAQEKTEVTSDTIRLDVIDSEKLHKTQVIHAIPVEEDEPADPFTASWEPEYDQPMGEYVPPQPIVFPSRSRIRELKRKLVEGPEKQYYKLLEKGVGKLQVAIFFSLLVVLLAAGSTVMYALGWVQDDRMKLLIFGQFLAMLISALLGSFQLIDGVTDMLKKRFSINSMLVFTFLACCADGVLCLIEGRVPCCAAFSLTMTMSLWSTYHRRYVRMGQLDTMRKANRLNGVGITEAYYEENRGLLRFEAQVEDFMDTYTDTGKPEKRLDLYSMIALFVCVGIGITAGVLGGFSGGVQTGISNGIQVLAVSMLAALPASAFVAAWRPYALLEKKLHHLGTVLCGWQGIQALCGKAYFPVNHEDLFPAGSVKLNGVKFYGSRLPEEIVAYSAALIEADGSGLAPLFAQLLASRNGPHFDVQQIRAYENGGIGGIVEDQAVLAGSMSFLKEMGVEIPEGIRVSQAVCVAIDGELCGLFAISYEKDRGAAAGLTSLCSYRGLRIVLTGCDFMLTESFLRSKFGVNTRRLVIPARQEQEQLAQKTQQEGSRAAVLITGEGLAPAAFGVTGARTLRSAANAGTLIHMIGGGIGMAIMITLTVLGALELLTPANMFLYHLVWMIPGVLITEWTRSI